MMYRLDRDRFFDLRTQTDIGARLGILYDVVSGRIMIHGSASKMVGHLRHFLEIEESLPGRTDYRLFSIDAHGLELGLFLAIDQAISHLDAKALMRAVKAPHALTAPHRFDHYHTRSDPDEDDEMLDLRP